MSLSFIENKDKLKSYIKLEIHEIQILNGINVPLPYGINISLGNLYEKNIEPIKKEKEVFQSQKNQFVYYFDKNTLNCNNIFDKEIVINSYTTSIFGLKKNFASLKIPIYLNKNNNNKKQMYFLNDINDNSCIKLLMTLDINISTNESNENKSEITKDILYKNNKNKTIQENIIKKNNISRANTNYVLNNHNTYLISTNYNSSNGNSLLNFTNNINNNLNITLPLNLSPITLIGKSSSFFIDSKNKQMENNLKIINNNLLYKNGFKSNKENNLMKKEEDSIIINDNEIEEVEDYNNSGRNKEENNINKLINKKNKELDNKLSLNEFKKENYIKRDKDAINKKQLIEKEKEQYKNKIKNFSKTKQNYQIKIMDIKENLKSIEENKYRQNIQKESDIYEKTIFQNLNYISNISNNLDKILFIKSKDNNKINNLSHKKPEFFNISDIIEQEKNKTKKRILCLNKTIPHNPLYIKKLNFQNKPKGEMNNIINSGRKSNNKKCTPINYKFKKFNRKLSSSTSNISNSENVINESKNKILNTEGKYQKKSINNDSINASKFKKIKNINFKRKSLKIQGNLKIPFYNVSIKNNFDSNSNYQSKLSFIKMNLNKEVINSKKNSTITNKKYSDKTINKINILKQKKIERNLNNKNNYFHKNSYITLDKNSFFIENISPNNNQMNNSTLNKINNLGKKKLQLFDKIKKNNNKKTLNFDNFKGFQNINDNNFKGNTLIIKSNNNTKNIKNNTIRLSTNPNESNKKKNIKFRNYFNLSGNFLLLNVQNPNQSTRENKRKNSNQKILLTELIK